MMILNIWHSRRILSENRQSFCIFMTYLAAAMARILLIVDVDNIWVVSVSKVAETDKSLIVQNKYER